MLYTQVYSRSKNTTTSNDADWVPSSDEGDGGRQTVAVEMRNTLGRSATGHRAQARATPVCLTLCRSTSLASYVDRLPGTWPAQPMKILLLPTTFRIAENRTSSLILSSIFKPAVKIYQCIERAVTVANYNCQSNVYQYAENINIKLCLLKALWVLRVVGITVPH